MTHLASLSSAVLVLLLAGCASPLGGEDLEISAGPSVLPGTGATLGFAQRVWSNEDRRLDVELDWTRQGLDSKTVMGKTGDSLDQVRLGGRLRFDPTSNRHWTARFGVVWLRAQGDARYLDDGQDFGGIYVGGGYEFELGPHLITGPDLSVHLVESEGRGGDSGAVPQLGWRLSWRL